jgi:hypothetical protein
MSTGWSWRLASFSQSARSSAGALDAPKENGKNMMKVNGKANID